MSAISVDWATVVEDNRAWIERVVLARTGGERWVDDVIQEVNLAVARSTARPADPDEVTAWLCTIVVRQCALVVRNQARQQRKLDGFRRTQQPAAPNGDPIFWLLHEERREIVREELAALDSQARQLLVWKYLENRSYQDIALRLGVSAHAAEYRLIESRKQLRQRLQARGVEGGEQP